MRICLLSTINSFQLGYMLKRLRKNKISVDSVLIDSKSPSKKELLLEEKRTEGKLPHIPITSYGLEWIPFYFVENHCSKISSELIKNRKIDLILNCGTPRILKTNILKSPSIGVLNCHPGLLPNFRGCTCVEWSIYLDKPVGNTVHFMTEGIDEGPIVMKEKVKCKMEDVYSDIRTRVYKRGFDLYIQAIKKLTKKEISKSSLGQQVKGKYFPPIPDSKMQEVIQKLRNKKYRYQTY